MRQATLSLIQATLAGPKAVIDIHYLPLPPILDFPQSYPTLQLV